MKRTALLICLLFALTATIVSGATGRTQGEWIYDKITVIKGLFSTIDSSATSTVLNAETLERKVTGATAGADGAGVGLQFKIETETNGTADEAALIEASWMDATASTTDSALTFSCRVNDATLAAARLASPGVFQVYAGGTVPTFSVATVAGEIGAEGDIETDANLDVAGTANIGSTLTVGGAMTFNAAQTVNVDNATNNASLTGITLNRSVTSTAAGADSLATAFSIGLETETNATVDEAGLLTWTWLDATANSTDSKLDVGVRISDTTATILTVTSPGVVQIHDGTVPSFSVATSAGSLGVETNLEVDGQLDVNGASQFTGGVTFSTTPGIAMTDAATNTVVNALSLNRSVTSTGVGAAGAGVSVNFYIETDTNTTVDQAASIDATWLDPAVASTDSELNFSVRVADSTVERMTLASPGVLQLHDGTVPTFSVATAAGEVGVEGDLEVDGNIDNAGTLTQTGVATFTASPIVNSSNATNNAVLVGATIKRSVDTTGVGAVGLGSALLFSMETGTDVTLHNAGQIDTTWTDHTAGTEDSEMNFSVEVNSTDTEAMTLNGTTGLTCNAGISTTGAVAAGTLSITSPTTVEYLLSSTQVNISGTGEVHLYEGVSGKTAIVTKVVVRGCSGTTDMGTDAVLQFGCNHGTSNDVITALTLTKPTAATTYAMLIPRAFASTGIGNVESTACLYGTNGTFAVNKTTSATTSTTCYFDTFGYLF